MKLPNIRKDNLTADVVGQLHDTIPRVRTYLAVDDDVYSALAFSLPPYAVKDDCILFMGWKVISREMICELGEERRIK